ncbi:putative Arf-GAP domain and FG repeat-containing protein 2 [Hypsibius exemplaris]|uniref:Arf-GAP domain and FG repeat-containing protein 2 n=1 Tax=Hypsibius exemplaris TaxID=2072580 RepID=A0A1W0WXI5_HYPEX|nr:putative Arf-GAP domain and FG repeat-containing protein 2 [Hypsibius exemplaris]
MTQRINNESGDPNDETDGRKAGRLDEIVQGEMDSTKRRKAKGGTELFSKPRDERRDGRRNGRPEMIYGERGPTYLNDTIGAFVCTGCSGILRGLNPPHRIKSISMGTFNDDEVKFIQLRGNAFCRKVWLWNYDPQLGPRPPETRDDQKMKDFLALKYEKKKWFHAAHDTHIADQLKQHQQEEDAASLGSSGKGTDSPSSLSRRTSTNSHRSVRNEPAVAVPSNGVNQTLTGSTGNISLPRSHTSNSVNHGQQPQPQPDQSHRSSSSASASEDLFGMFGGMSVSSPPAHIAPNPPTFSAFPAAHAQPTAIAAPAQNEWASFARSQTTPAFPAPTHQQPVLPPKNQNHQSSQQQPQRPAMPIPSPAPLQPLQPTTTKSHPPATQKPPTSPAKTISSQQSDKYAALAELDEILNGASPATSKPSLPDPQTFLASTSPQQQGYGRGVGNFSAWGTSSQQIPSQQSVGNFQSVPQNGGGGFWTDSINQPQGGLPLPFDANNVWGQMPVYHSGVTAASNPFLGGAPAAATAPGPRAAPGSYNTNPFL